MLDTGWKMIHAGYQCLLQKEQPIYDTTFPPYNLEKDLISCTICVDAVTALIVGNTPIEETIRNCKDVTKFVTCRNVKGGGAYQGIYLGKIVRFYHAKGSNACLEYVINGHKVPESDGAKPLMDLNGFPDDIDYDWYVERSVEILKQIGYLKVEKQQRFF